MATAPLWRSPFRPFFLLGALYGPLLLISWLLTYTGLLPLPAVSGAALPQGLHQHELVFGFATAIVIGFIMTALPSWAGTEEITGAPLALLVSSWAVGRVAVGFSSLLPAELVAILDLSFPLLFIAIVGPGLRRVNIRYPLGLAVIIAGFLVGNLCYYLGVIQQDQQLWSQGLRLGFYAILFHCSLTVGILAPIFTENALAGKGRPAAIGHNTPLEWLSVLSVMAVAGADLAQLPPVLTAGLALACALLHILRLARWRSLEIIDTPIVWPLHLGFGWLCLALLLFAGKGFGLAIAAESWVHAFTVGGFGLMSLGLMIRVSRKHTGRSLDVPGPMVIAFLMLAAAALVRVVLPLTPWRQELLLLSALLWALPYLIYLGLCGPILVRPSLPRQAGPGPGRTSG